ncbi:MAG: Modification methylase DpnIIB [Syntrophomonadaceae bacterium]|nr:Modification methylase DpnIIB [Bacillota bacterium]
MNISTKRCKKVILKKYKNRKKVKSSKSKISDSASIQYATGQLAQDKTLSTKEIFINNIFFKDSRDMSEIPNNLIHLIVTSPPYFKIKDYSKDGYQKDKMSDKIEGQIGDIGNYELYLNEMLKVWKECERVLKPNGKLIINVPLMPMLKKELTTHYNRHIFDINADIENSILKNTKLFLYDIFIWKRTNPSKSLMFGSYPYPRNFYAQNTVEFITVYVKDGISDNNLPAEIKNRSKLTEKEWVEYTKQVWDIPIPNKNDIAFGKHPAIMPEEIVKRCIKLFTFVGDIVLDPFAGSGTTLKVAKELGRYYVGYEIMKNYKNIIERKLSMGYQINLI